ncbi:TSUP family transporter [Sphingomonas sp. Leaf4]|uniref:TSUP family transporter n=1 Tax=Sphingomonas sp. Leaf4 TaxID=2876553 RepID=UPI001E31DE0F|nr:TSUP family transporter [Sphingomonas sp. Leaf4]
MDFQIILALMAVAFVAGTIDAMAGGGGLLTIPALLAAGVPPVAALGTNKLQSACGTAGAAWAFWRDGQIDVRRFARPALASFAGAGVGAALVQTIDPSFLAGLLPILLVAMAGYFLFGPRLSDVDTHVRLAPAGLLLAVAGIGLYDGFFGPGTGSFFTLLLVTAAGLGATRAVAHTKLLNLASNLAGLAVLVMGGAVWWGLGLAMAVASVAGGQLGARLAIRWGGRAIRPLLVVLSLALTVKLVADPGNPLRGWIGV